VRDPVVALLVALADMLVAGGVGANLQFLALDLKQENYPTT